MAKPSNSALRRPPLLKRSTTKRREAERHYAMKPSHCLCLLFLVSILVASSAVVTVSPNKETTWEEATRKAARAPAAQLADEAFLARLCDREQQRGRPPAPRILPWCTPQLHASRRQGAHQFHHLPVPAPSRDGEQIDPRYGVSKRLVPSGPNRLHN
ncbi:CLAVATA3/ESR (CLE)-related protein 10 [Sorghum bicolor]|nr:CLAVATA3/ESR (CLE)-related protein 10 [Sorghum bicolor]|eukprot:XP_002456394.2 CLAVATA3/ESR (CLE)-related protein 10 [Sorghum bicolor]